jgi:hypothetical protein
MKKVFAITYFFAVLLINACSQQNKITPGKIYTHIAIKNDTSLSYSIYIPIRVVPSKAPAFIFFDPHGSGELPVTLYQNLADMFGVILIGNNNSSNNTDMSLISSSFSILLKELKDQYEVDEKNIALWGFSGGAKAAMINAGSGNAISYCIYGGSVIDEIKPSVNYLGFNGKQDMNYTDLLGFAAQQRDNNNHFQIEFHGKHAWPDSITAADAFRWLLLEKMQHKEIQTDNEVIENVNAHYQKDLTSAITSKNLMDAMGICNKAIHFLSGLSDVSFYIKNRATLAADPMLAKEIKDFQETFTQETQIKSQYQNDLFTKDTMFWKKEIDGLWLKSKMDKSGMYDRLLGYLSLAGYSIANRAFQGNDINAIRQILFIYQHADPTNPEQAFMRAKLYVLQNDYEKARAAIKEAVQLGIDKNRISSDILLKNL